MSQASVGPCVFALSRLFICFAQDGLLPKGLGAEHAASGIPRNSLLVVGGLGMVVAGFLPISLLGELISTGTLLAFGTVCAAVIRMRLSEPQRERPFKVPFRPLIAPLGILSSLFLLYSMGPFALARIGAWQVIGLVLLAVVALLGLMRRRA